MSVNYKQVIQDLSGIAYYHPQINSFGFGDITQLTMDIETKKEPVYTKMWVSPATTTLSQNRLIYTFNVTICDIINNDSSNEEDVMSDTLEIIKDVFTILYQSFTANYGGFTLDYEPLFGSSVQPFIEKFETVLGGWTMTIQIEQPFDYNKCILPITGLTLPNNVLNVNYKLILSDLKQISTQHEQINSFGFGDIDQITMDIETKKEPLYTRMWVTPATTTLDRSMLRYNFQIIILDIINDDLSNQRDVMSDTLEICKDIFTVLYLSQYETEWNASVEPFTERFETVLGGWTMNITITQPFEYNRCVLPERPFVYSRWNELAELWNTIARDWEDA